MRIRDLFALVGVIAALSAAACGGSAPPPAETKAATAAPAVDYEAQGKALATEVLDTFNAAVAETAVLVKDKPAPATLKPQLQALFDKYKEKMTALNAKRLALASPEVGFGAAAYMNENRPKAVFAKDNTLGPFTFHYVNTVKDAEVAAFLSTKITTLIDIGDAR
jgi:hypothetical protein